MEKAPPLIPSGGALFVDDARAQSGSAAGAAWVR